MRTRHDGILETGGFPTLKETRERLVKRSKKTIMLEFSHEGIIDMISALSFFDFSYPDRKGSVITRRAMKRIEKNLWEALEVMNNEDKKRKPNSHKRKRVR